MKFLPMSKSELPTDAPPDFVLVTGDAYVDHPSFGAAVIGRVLESRGYTVGIIAQPNWRDVNAFRTFGKPRLGFLCTSGNLDSMVSHYSAAKHRRKQDLYSPDGKTSLRPDRAVIVYGNKIREAYKDAVIVLGGVEASLRRLAHYDYWEDTVRRSVLLDAAADILVYGMGERQIVEISDGLAKGLTAEQLTNIRGTAYKAKSLDNIENYITLPSFDEVAESKAKYGKSFMLQYENSGQSAKRLVEGYDGVYVVQNPPAAPLATHELDAAYELPYTRAAHPKYPNVPAFDEVMFSLVSNRGCFGGCAFCSLTFHQGRIIQSRSHGSLIAEARKLIREPGFKGYIHDVGGPTANFRHTACTKQSECKKKLCLYPQPCKNLNTDHGDYLSLLRKLRVLPGVKKVFIRSGIRFDYLMLDKSEFFQELVQHHVSGQLKVAPESVSAGVLDKMQKPEHDVYKNFAKKFYSLNKRLGLKQFLVPYLMTSHPGSTLDAAIELAEYLRDSNLAPEQVQDFYPTPGTLSTCMYYTGRDPRNGADVYVPKGREKAMQRALAQYRLPKNRELVVEALKKAGRTDLIGPGQNCLIRGGTTPGNSTGRPVGRQAAKQTRSLAGKQARKQTGKPTGKWKK